MDIVKLTNDLYCRVLVYFTSKVGDLNDLTTSNKSNLVAAINELNLISTDQIATNYVVNINREYNNI